MTREEFFQQAMLRMADTILLRATEVPTPEQLAAKSREYAQALHDTMLVAMTRLDMDEELAKPRPRRAAPEPSGAPTLQPARLQNARPRGAPISEEGPPCPKCSAATKQRLGKFGAFWGCTNYPECRGLVNAGDG